MKYKTLKIFALLFFALVLPPDASSKGKAKLIDMESAESPYWIKIFQVKKIDSKTLKYCEPGGCTDGIEALICIGTNEEALYPPVFSDTFFFFIDGEDYKKITAKELGRPFGDKMALYSPETVGQKRPDLKKLINLYELPQGTWGILHVISPGVKIDSSKKLSIRYRLSNKTDSSVDYYYTKEIKIKH